MRQQRARVLAARMIASGEYSLEQIAQRVGVTVEVLDSWTRGRTFRQIVVTLRAAERPKPVSTTAGPEFMRAIER